MLNIVIPMAGLGSRFTKAGYTDPKPLIPVHGVPMIQAVIDNLTPSIPHRFIFICQRCHLEQYGLAEKLCLWTKKPELIALDGVTEGAACTVLAAKSLIDSNEQLMIANCDQYIDKNINDYLAVLEARELDGLIMTMQANDPKWSFVELNQQEFVTRVVEKVVISDQATVGIYNFRHGADFVAAAEKMIAENDRVNGEFYVAPAYNAMIASGKSRVGTCAIGAENHGMYGLGTPADLQHFLSLPVSLRLKELVT